MEETKRLFLPIRFGIFEVDLQAGELRKQGYKVKLQEQPFQLLIMLLDRSGDVVTREELQKKLWPADTFVDFERGLNRAINKLREALGDDADSPRFVETLPRRGYRFVAPVETPGPREPETPGRNRLVLIQPDLPYLPHKVENNVSTAVAPRRQVLPWAVAGMIAIVALFAYWKQWRAPQIVVDRPFVQFDLDVSPSEFTQPAISPDGMRIVFVSKGSLAIRRLDQTKTTQLAGTEGAFLPFFSPNGQWVAFFAAHKLQKVAVEGGAPITLCDATSPGGGSWGDDDNIVAALNGNRGLSQIVAAGWGVAAVDRCEIGLLGCTDAFVAANAARRQGRAVRSHKREWARLTPHPCPEWQDQNDSRKLDSGAVSRERIPNLLPAGDPVCRTDGPEPLGIDGPPSDSRIRRVKR
jgi:DNA-binding winged helix-turn-helix (wHTH) protein